MLVIETIIMLSLPRHMPINPSKQMLYMYVVYFENKAMAGDHIKVEWFLTTVKKSWLVGFRIQVKMKHLGHPYSCISLWAVLVYKVIFQRTISFGFRLWRIWCMPLNLNSRVTNTNSLRGTWNLGSSILWLAWITYLLQRDNLHIKLISNWEFCTMH